MYPKFYEAGKTGATKEERKTRFFELKEAFMATMSDEEKEEKGGLASDYIKSAQKAVRDLILNDGLRLDGRKTTEIRPIWTEVDYLPSCHGSSIFTVERPKFDHIDASTKLDEQLIDGALVRKTEKSCRTTTSSIQHRGGKPCAAQAVVRSATETLRCVR